MDDPNANPDPPLVTRVEPPPPPKPRPGFWGAVLWAVLFMLVLLVSLAVTAGTILAAHAVGADNPRQFLMDQLTGFATALQPPKPNEPPRPGPPVVICQAIVYGMLASQLATLALAVIVLRKRVGPDWKRQIGVRRPAAMHLILVAMTVPGLIIVAAGIQELVLRVSDPANSPNEAALRELFRAAPALVVLLAIAVGPGVVEELWCRGFLGRGLCARYGLAYGVFATSFIFAAMHGVPARLLVYTLMGAYLHFVYLAARSIWVPVVLHLLNNGTAVLIEFIPSWTRFVEAFDRDETGLRRVTDVASLALLVFAGAALWSSRAQVFPDRSKEQEGTAEQWKPEYPGISAPPPAAPAKLAYGAISRVAVVFTLVSFVALVAMLARVAARVPA
jgi:membrane protease YdiL (CAAX protease family)